MTSMSSIRNVFPEEEDAAWKQAIEPYPNHVPRFTTVADCLSFIEKYGGKCSNPDYPGLQHSITTFVSWEQVEKYILPKLKEYNKKWPSRYPKDEDLKSNRFVEDAEASIVAHYVQSRLELPIYRFLNQYTTMNTLKYLFHHMRCGILVMIRNNRLVIFAPFVNKDYRNTWADALHIDHDNDVASYYNQKSKFSRVENYIDKSEWWANGNIICSEHCPPGVTTSQYWGDHFLFQLMDLIAETCNQRVIPDCDFFINKRDYPQLKYNTLQQQPVEPYGFIFDKDDRLPEEDVPLSEHKYGLYTPILSFYSSDRFADILFPPSEDWEAATGEIFPPSMHIKPEQPPKPRDLFTSENLKKFEQPWSDKVPVAFFRGTATGGGVTPDNNQRLKVATLSHAWNLDSSNPRYGLLDAKITAWNMRDKKIAGVPMTYVKPIDFAFKVNESNFTPIYAQSKYKYLLYIEGHCAACRYGFMMCLGSVILKVESRCVADQMWYFPLLKPYVDHIPVKSDLSDLADVIEWCRHNDDKCQDIARNARILHDKYISREGILDYMQLTLTEISKRWAHVPDWARNYIPDTPPPVVPEFADRGYCCFNDGVPTYCVTCEQIKAQEESAKKQDAMDAKKVLTKSNARARMKRLAEQDKEKQKRPRHD